MKTAIAVAAHGRRREIPTLAEVEQISALDDSVIANLRITQAYHQISTALAGMLGPTANWCAYATWASKQAGQSIRRQDVARTFERLLGGSPEVTRKLDELTACLPQGDSKHAELRPQVREALRPLAIFDRVSDAGAAGNRKVFDEIGSQYVRFIEIFRGDQVFDEAKIERFVESLRPGEPPQGQGHLKSAFRNLYRAMFERRPRIRTQLVLLSSLEVGYHEQIRLQPEIAAALDAPVVDPRQLRRQLLRALFPRLGVLSPLADLYLRRSTPFDRLWDQLIAALRQVVRQLVTELIMTMSLPGGRLLRLGHDVEAPFPESVQLIAVPELREILALVDPTPDSPRQSGAEDWADFGERMHYITDFFRSHVEDRSLLEPPFDPQQTAAIRQGRMPSGRL